MSNFKAEFYATDDGSKPAKDFILSQDTKMKAKLLGLVDILEQYGNQLREPYSKPLDDGIFELRAKIGSDISRVMYFSEIALAKKYRKDFLERNGRI
ncbi:MAG: type II toxin-antitoxin system RelE/ParE family toxin [Lachnospiraceae bacterium]|jgi:hypothetical protein